MPLLRTRVAKMLPPLLRKVISLLELHMSLDNTPSPRCGGAHNGEVAIGERPYCGEPLGKPGSLFLQVAENNFLYQDLYRLH